MSLDFFLQQSSRGEAFERPTPAGPAARPFAAKAVLHIVSEAYKTQPSCSKNGGPGEGEPCPSAPVPPPAKRWQSPHCLAVCTWLPRLSRARVRRDQLVLRRLGPTLRTWPRLAGSESGKGTAGFPPLPRGTARRGAARPESGHGTRACTCQLPAWARFQLGRGDRRAAASSPPPRGPGASGARAGVAPLPPRAGRWSAACAALPSPTCPSAPQRRASGAQCGACTRRGASAGQDGPGRAASPRAPRPLGVSFVRRRAAAALQRQRRLSLAELQPKEKGGK